MNDEHRWIREQLGAFALGAADEFQRASIRAHLAACLSCQVELGHLQRVATQVSVLRSGRASEPQPLPSPERAERLFARVAAERRRQRRRRSYASAAMAVAAVLAIFTVVVNPFANPAGESVEFAVVPQGVTASAHIQDWGWGSQVQLEIVGLSEADQQLTAWLEQPDGTRIPAGSFTTTGDDLTMMLGAGANTADAVALGISNAGGDVLLRAPLGTT